MIGTCTLNPSLDYYMEFEDDLKKNITNRSQLEYYEAGGKGINVSIVLNNLGIPTNAFGFVGGFTKDFYISLLAKYENIRPNFTYTDGHTRVNVKLRADGAETDLNAAGPYITNEDMQNLKNKTASMYEGDYFVLAGSTQEYLLKDTEEMLRNVIKEKVKVILDTNAVIMKDLLDQRPFLYKTTPEELSLILDKKFKNQEEVIAGIKELHALGAENALVLLDNSSAVLSCDSGTYECAILSQGAAINTVGTGDSLVAGFLMNYMRTKDPVDSFRFGASCGAATAYSKSLATRGKIDDMYESTEVKKID